MPIIGIKTRSTNWTVRSVVTSEVTIQAFVTVIHSGLLCSVLPNSFVHGAVPQVKLPGAKPAPEDLPNS